MPRIPIIRPPEDSGGLATGDGPEMLPPDEAAGLRMLEARTARIDRELAVSQSWLAGLTRLAAAEDVPEGPSPGFMRQFLAETDHERALVLKPLPPNRQAPLEQDLMALRQGFAERAAAVEADGMALRRRLALHRTLEGYRSGVAKDPGLYDDAAGRMQALVADLGLPEERRQALDLHVRDALGNAAVDGLMREPERAERLLSSGLYDDALSEASKASRLKEAQGLAARNRLLARERTLSALTIRVAEGVASDEAITAAAQDGILTAAAAEQLRAWNLEAVQAAELRQARIRRVGSAATLDPSDPEDKAAADAYWEEVSEVYASDDTEAQRRAELAFVARIGVLPDGLRRRYQGALLSADPVIAVSGATVIDALSQLNPALVGDIPEDQRRRAAAIAQYAALDLPPERVIELAESGKESIPAEQKAAASEGESAEFPEATGTRSTGRPPGPIAEGGSTPRDDAATPTETDNDSPDKRFEALVRDHEALLDLHEAYLDLYERVAAGEITREEATREILASIDEALPATNEAGSPVNSNLRLRQTLQRLATDIFDAGDQAEAEKILSDAVMSSERAEEIGELVLSLLPITGEIISARDAYAGFVAAIAAARRGDTGEALQEGAEATLAALGAIPFIGSTTRLGRGSVKGYRAVRQHLSQERRKAEKGSQDVSQPSAETAGESASLSKPASRRRRNPYKDVDGTQPGEPTFSWVHKRRLTTNRTLIKQWERTEGPWPIDPETGEKYHVDHKIPLADGGPDHVSNIRPLSRKDHIAHHRDNGDSARWARRGHRK